MSFGVIFFNSEEQMTPSKNKSLDYFFEFFYKRGLEFICESN